MSQEIKKTQKDHVSENKMSPSVVQDIGQVSVLETTNLPLSILR